MTDRSQKRFLELLESERVLADLPGVTVCPFMEAATHPGVDLVVIASPNQSHFPLAAAAIMDCLAQPFPKAELFPVLS